LKLSELSKKRVLVVEANTEVRRALVRLLKEYIVIAVDNVKSATTAWRDNQIDMVLSCGMVDDGAAVDMINAMALPAVILTRTPLKIDAPPHVLVIDKAHIEELPKALKKVG